MFGSHCTQSAIPIFISNVNLDFHWLTNICFTVKLHPSKNVSEDGLFQEEDEEILETTDEMFHERKRKHCKDAMQ